MTPSDRIVDLTGENVDCVIRGGELTDPSLTARRVGDLQLGAYAASSYLERAGRPAHPRELDGGPAPHRGLPVAANGEAHLVRDASGR